MYPASFCPSRLLSILQLGGRILATLTDNGFSTTRNLDSSTSSAWGIMWDCSAHAYFSAVRWTYRSKLRLWQHMKNHGVFLSFYDCRLYKAVTKRNCFAEAFKSLVEGKTILLLWNLPILTARSELVAALSTRREWKMANNTTAQKSKNQKSSGSTAGNAGAT